MEKTAQLSSVRKTDRRTLYTKRVIKEALIELMGHKPFPKITVKELCAAAEINRGTLYLHYLDLADVLDEIENEVLAAAREDLEQIDLFDDGLSLQMEGFLTILSRQELASLLLVQQAQYSHLLEKMVQIVRQNVLPAFKTRLGLTDALANSLFTFLFHGCLAMNRELAKTNDYGWTEQQALMHRFTAAGLKAIQTATHAASTPADPIPVGGGDGFLGCHTRNSDHAADGRHDLMLC